MELLGEETAEAKEEEGVMEFIETIEEEEEETVELVEGALLGGSELFLLLLLLVRFGGTNCSKIIFRSF